MEKNVEAKKLLELLYMLDEEKEPSKKLINKKMQITTTVAKKLDIGVTDVIKLSKIRKYKKEQKRRRRDKMKETVDKIQKTLNEINEKLNEKNADYYYF